MSPSLEQIPGDCDRDRDRDRHRHCCQDIPCVCCGDAGDALFTFVSSLRRTNVRKALRRSANDSSPSVEAASPSDPENAVTASSFAAQMYRSM
jgi:hypothetical protein